MLQVPYGLLQPLTGVICTLAGLSGFVRLTLGVEQHGGPFVRFDCPLVRGNLTPVCGNPTQMSGVFTALGRVGLDFSLVNGTWITQVGIVNGSRPCHVESVTAPNPVTR